MTLDLSHRQARVVISSEKLLVFVKGMQMIVPNPLASNALTTLTVLIKLKSDIINKGIAESMRWVRSGHFLFIP